MLIECVKHDSTLQSQSRSALIKRAGRLIQDVAIAQQQAEAAVAASRLTYNRSKRSLSLLQVSFAAMESQATKPPTTRSTPSAGVNEARPRPMDPVSRSTNYLRLRG